MLQLKMFLISIKINRLLLAFALVLGWSLQAQVSLSPNAEISILTCSKGDDLYNTFGHTAIRIHDLANKIDIVFNYGMFSFGGSAAKDQLNFGVKFVRGKLEYWLGIEEFNNFMYSYTRQERWVFEQTLNLTLAQKQQLFDALVVNFEPENRYYRYDFFFDNCSSRVRDILEDAIGPVFGAANSPIHEPTQFSFIDLIDPYICNKPWLDFGMDVMLGLPSSRKASKYEMMFLPYHLKDQISLANGLVKKESMILNLPDRKIGERHFSFVSPFMIFSYLFLAIAIITYRNYKAAKHYFALDRLLLFVSGLMGCLFLFMWLATDHLPAHANLNMFWAFPFNLIALFFVKRENWLPYFKFTLGLSSFILLAWFISPQQYHVAILPLAGIFIVRYLKLLSFKNA